MHVAMVCHGVAGGHPRYTVEVANALLAAGARVTLLVPEGFDDWGIAAPGLEWERLPGQVGVGQSAAGALATHLRREASICRWVARSRPDVLHVQDPSWFVGWLSLTLVGVLGVRRVLTVHSQHDGGIRGRLLRLSWRSSDVLVVHAESLAAMLEARAGRSLAAEVVVAPHGVWTSHVVPRRAEPTHDFGVVGVLRPYKNVGAVVEGLSRLRARPAHADATLLVAGLASDPGYLAGLDQAAPGVSWRLGEMSGDEYAQTVADVGCLVLAYDGFEAQSGVLFDALAAGVPVVALAGTPVAEVVEALGVGAVASSADDLVEAMADVRSRAIPDAAFEAKGLSWARHAERLLEAYR